MNKWLLLLLIPAGALAADDGRVSFLEQEVRNLQRQVQSLSRQVDELRTRPERPRGVAPAAPAKAASLADPDRWVNAARWQKLKPGMSELEVVESLGPPTSMREEGGARVLLYALEIGSSGFLGGSVTIRDRLVVSVRAPTLQ
ncbi:MAG TPA: hypothetical protein VMF52_09355 [Steroidobacteraceae bacterium]|nr:hypothetical protein [Steroidobacteraceae bacterium]